MASINPSIPNEVMHAAPNWSFFNDNGLIFNPKEWQTNLVVFINKSTIKAGKNLATPVLFLWSVSPLSFLIFDDFDLIKLWIS